jgi:phage terminase Nu1 subunit (DNA packaging protein)
LGDGAVAKLTDKQKGVLNSLLNGEESVSSPVGDDESYVSTAKREAAKARHVSMEQLALIIDRDTNTIRKWVNNEELPFVMKADRDLGKAWVFDTAEVIRWMEKRAADAVAQKLGGSAEGMTTEAEAKRRRAIAQAITAEIELAELLQSIVRISVVAERVAADYAEMRSRLIGVSDAVAAKMDADHAALVKKEVADEINVALASLKYDRNLTVAKNPEDAPDDGIADAA